MVVRFIGCLVLAALAGCAEPSAPSTHAMGAGPACDLRIDIAGDHRCPVRHVAPDEGQQLISNGTRSHD